jgi:hypothetical protein
MEGGIARPAHCVKERENAADVIQMKVRDKDFIQLGGMHTEGEEVSDRTAAYIENKRITVTKLDQKARCALTDSHGSGPPGTTGGDSHFVLSKTLFSRNIVFWVGFYFHAGFRYYRSLRYWYSCERQWVAIFRSSRFSGEAVVLRITGVHDEGQYQTGCNDTQQYSFQWFTPK